MMSDIEGKARRCLILISHWPHHLHFNKDLRVKHVPARDT